MASKTKIPKLPISGTDIFDAERILKERTIDGIVQYYIKWRGYPNSWNSWEPEGNILNPVLLPAWEKAKKKQNEKKTVKASAKKRQRESTSKEYIPRKSSRRSKPLNTSATTASSTLAEPTMEPDDSATLTTTPNEPQARNIEVTVNGETVTFEQYSAQEFAHPTQ